ncbi:undecaprenyl-phosphate glucose phosphotransferase [Hydrogenovibrio halophilus]|uniref:undecaprenyl-phosphate glucose phosphotransferase n=1 Tax=Hydrogenovibrio halophilus TaxID=373391 RepID=UPI00039A543E|nr:undecaprenyl-phosphate glucose phosphotransferase [Hydrogenovibrio halophilus]
MVWLQRALDLLLPFLIGLGWFLDQAWLKSEMPWAWLAFLYGGFFVIVAQLSGVYRQWLRRSAFTIMRLVFQSALVSLSVAAVVWGVWFDSRLAALDVLLGWWLVFLLWLVGYRLLIYFWVWLVRWRFGQQRRVVICGAGRVGQTLANVLQNTPGLGYQVVGFFDDAPLPASLQNQGYRHLGSLSSVMSTSMQSAFDEVFICLPLQDDLQIKALMDGLADSTKVVKFVPDLFAFDLMHSHFVDLKGLPVFSVYDSPLTSLTSQWLKRGLDVAVSVWVFGFLWPLLLGIGVAVKLSSQGPVLFKQVRYGMDGREIKVYKFRTMTVMENGEKVEQAKANDPRVTAVGRFLRRTSLDELPQFYNVLQGRMSVVGPRPHAKAHNELYRDLVPRYMQRHLVKPGITGWAQVNGWRGETDTLDKMQKRVEFDLHYIKNWSLWLDLKIMVLTLFALRGG